MNVRVEYEATPIRHIAVQCPACGRWYRGHDISDSDLQYEYQIHFATFTCPVCGEIFGYTFETRGVCRTINVTECSSSEEVYKDCLRRKETWE